MKKSLFILLLVFFAAALFGQEDTEKKAMAIFKADMPKDSYNALKLMKRINKIYEGFKNNTEQFTPGPADIARGFGLFEFSSSEDIYPNYVPPKKLCTSTLKAIAAPGEKRIAVLGVYPLEDIVSLRVKAGDLTGPNGKVLSGKNIKINAVKYDYEPEGLTWYCKGKYAIPANEITCLKETPRLFYIIAAVPEDAAAGQYKGKLTVTGGKKESGMEFIVEVRPLKFETIADEYYFGAFAYYDFTSPDTGKLEKILLEMQDRGMNIMHGKIFNAIKFKAGAAEVDFTNIEKNALLLKKFGHKRWILELTGLPNEVVDALGCRYYDEKFNKAYKSILTQLKDRMDKGGWPQIQFMYDEPREIDTDNYRPLARTYWDLENLYPLHSEVGIPALPSYERDDGGPRFEDKTKRALYWEQGSKIPLVMTHGISLSEKLTRESLKNGNMVYLYNDGYGRYQFGLQVFQFSAKGHIQFWYFSDNRLNTLAKYPVNFAVVLEENSPYIPTLRWLRSSEGVNDFRYIYTLQKKVEKAANKSAPEVLAAQKYLDTIKSFKFENDNGDVREADTVGANTLRKYSGEKLDEMRNKLAEHIIALDSLK